MDHRLPLLGKFVLSQNRHDESVLDGRSLMADNKLRSRGRGHEPASAQLHG